MRKEETSYQVKVCQVEIQFFNGGLGIVKDHNVMLYNMTFHYILAGFSFGAFCSDRTDCLAEQQ